MKSSRSFRMRSMIVMIAASVIGFTRVVAKDSLKIWSNIEETLVDSVLLRVKSTTLYTTEYYGSLGQLMVSIILDMPDLTYSYTRLNQRRGDTINMVLNSMVELLAINVGVFYSPVGRHAGFVRPC